MAPLPLMVRIPSLSSDQEQLPVIPLEADTSSETEAKAKAEYGATVSEPTAIIAERMIAVIFLNLFFDFTKTYPILLIKR